MHLPAAAKIILVFSSVLVLARIKVPLWLSLVFGAVALNLAAPVAPLTSLANLGRSLVTAELWLLLSVTTLIIELGRYTTRDRNSEVLVSAVRQWGGRHGRAVSLMALPAAVGLIPMPAGALFSAPLVGQAGDIVEGEGEWKTAVNYWFRHVWEYWWPLYPGVIVAMSVFELEAWRFILVQFPFTLVAVGVGYVTLIRPHLSHLHDPAAAAAGSSRGVLRVVAPLMVVVASVFVLPFLLDAVVPGLDGSVRKLLAVLIGLVLGLGVAFATEDSEARSEFFRHTFAGKSRNVLLSLGGVMVFKQMLEFSSLLPAASEELLASGIPLAVAVAALPLLAGVVTGVAVGFTGVSFPLVVGLVGGSAGLSPLATLVLAYGFGYAGMMLSPVHLCLLVTRDYFNVSLRHVYGMLAPCVLTIMGYSVLAYLLLSRLGF